MDCKQKSAVTAGDDGSSGRNFVPDSDAALALSCFLAEYGWPLRVPTGKMTTSELWSCSDDLLAGLMKLPRRELHRLTAFRKSFSAADVLEEMERKQVAMVSLGQAGYPACLAQIHDPPAALFLKGPSAQVTSGRPEDVTSGRPEDVASGRPGNAANSGYGNASLDRLDALMQRPRVAIVGARAASDYGIDAATNIARDLARHGVCVVSGLALGIDAAAHRGSVAEGGRSIAVLGCGVDVVYPRGNRALYGNLVEHGLVISEYPPGTSPIAWRFPARNRIMAGLSNAVIVVEARAKSGALITADFCLEEGRDVFAVPGSIFSDLSIGPHKLLRLGAAPVTCAEDVLDNLGIESDQQSLPLEDVRPPADLTEVEKRLFLALDGRHCHPDVLASRAGLDGARTAATLVSLELRGLARHEPGRGYSR
ncbi:MAG: DNA-processing protein DprA [Thermoleophilia bacterium]